MKKNITIAVMMLFVGMCAMMTGCKKAEDTQMSTEMEQPMEDTAAQSEAPADTAAPQSEAQSE